MKRVWRLICVGLVTFIIIKISTFGWKNFADSIINYKPKNKLISERLKSHVHKLSYELGDRNIFSLSHLEKAADYITGQFRAYGYDVEFQEYTVHNRSVKNIIAIKKGTKLPAEVIIVGAHYDTCFNPGADDNASGVAGLLELSRLILQRETFRTIKFIAFVCEEPPFFKTEDMGSRFYARSAKINGEDVKAALILEMLGYYTHKAFSQRYPPIFGFFHRNKGNFIAAVSNFNSRTLLNNIVKIFKKHSEFPLEWTLAPEFVPVITFSDHWSFWQEGFPAVMITDTAFLRNHNYHSDSDTWEKLNYDNMACVIEGLYPVVVELAR